MERLPETCELRCGSTMFFTGILGLVGHQIELNLEHSRKARLMAHAKDRKMVKLLQGDSETLGKYEYVTGMRALLAPLYPSPCIP